jgi:hypothetical protein
MKVPRISDWTLEDRLFLDGPPLVVMFLEADKRAADLRRWEFRRVAREHPDARFVEVDLIENPSMAQRYSITAAPSVLVFIHGVEVARHTGAHLEATVDRILGNSV